MNIGINNNLNGLIEINADDIYTQNLYIDGVLLNPSSNNDIINQPIDLEGTNNLVSTNVNGNLIQPYSNASSSLQNLTVNNELNMNGDITQTNGSTSLQNLACQTLNLNSYITQNNSSNVSNTLGTTTIDNLIITNSLQLPSNISNPQAIKISR
jgi:hypothetical protein